MCRYRVAAKKLWPDYTIECTLAGRNLTDETVRAAEEEKFRVFEKKGADFIFRGGR
jgi:hypothetical protein